MNFPIDHIKKTDKVLCLFAAAFGGRNDVMHLHRNGIADVLMVDIDGEKLENISMATGYQYECGDAFDFIKKCRQQYDVLVSDQWTGMDELIHSQYYSELVRICRRTLILGISQNYIDSVGKPPGIYTKRSEYGGGVYWRVVSSPPAPSPVGEGRNTNE